MPNPRFVELAGNTVPRLPYVATNATLHTFLFDGRHDLLQRQCDRALNEPAAGALRYHVMGSSVLLTALYVAQMTSGNPVDRSKGFAKETDIGFWALVRGGRVDKPTSWRLHWLPIYMFVDSGSALVSGREVFGYPKYLSRLEHAGSSLDDDARVVVHTQHFAQFGPEREGTIAPLFALEKEPVGGPDDTFQVTSREWTDKMMARFYDSATHERMDRVDALTDAYKLLPFGGMPQIFLKQFRSLERPDDAALQAITAVEVDIDRLHGDKSLSDDYSLRLWQSDSHPLAEDLGLTSGQRANLARQFNLDFTVGYGDVLWS